MSSTATTRTPAKTAKTAKASRGSPARRPAARKRTLRAPGSRQRRLSRLLAWLLSTVLGTAGLAYAQVPGNTLPSGGQVVVGSGKLQQTGNLLIVNQATPRLGIDWQSFSIGGNATVEFRQPGADSIALNRVVGHSGSEIYGQLRSNGQVFLTNPNGVLFAPGAKVDVGGLVASTLDLSQQDFADGRFLFGATGSGGRVLNQGSLRANAGGYLALFGQQVENAGEMSVQAGSVVLASGRAATVSISGSGLISAVVTPGEAGSVANSGQISANGGLVTLTAHSAQGIAASLVNNTGIVRANALVERNGEVWITGDQVSTSGHISADATGSTDAGRITVKGNMADGSARIDGSLSAQAEGGRGGQIETSAARVSIAAATSVNTLSAAGLHGTWTIDPTNFTIGLGTGPLTTSGIGAATLADNLKTTSVVLATAAADTPGEFGDINVLAPVAWSANTSLTLTAHRNINVNADITATGATAALVMTPSSAGGGGSFNLGPGSKITLSGASSGLQIAGVTYTLLRDIDAIQAINASNATRSGNYALAVDIDASATATWNAGAGFVPIGSASAFSSNNSFRGRFDGLGHSLSGLTINRPTTPFVGLFGVVHDGVETVGGASRDTFIRNVTLSAADITGSQYVGALAGFVGKGTAGAGSVQISNVQVSGTVDAATGVGTVYAGGLVGQFANTPGLISGSSSSAVVTTAEANGNIGGLVGWVTAGSIDQSSASGAVTATSTTASRVMGGLVGYFDGAGTLTRSQASGNVGSANYAGGLVGYYGSTGGLTTVQASGSVTGISRAGGLLGEWNAAGALRDGSSSGTVIGTTYVGGLIGYAYNTTTPGGSLLGVRSSSPVTGQAYVGGLVGYSYNNTIDKLPGTGGAADINPSATGAVTAAVNTTNSNTVYAGGLVGQFQTPSGTIRIANATTSNNVTSAAPYGYVGGLVGAQSNGSVADSSATGAVLATNPINSRYLGGLIGYMDGAGALTRVSASGAVTGGYEAGGLVGYMGSTGITSFATATGNVSGQQYVGGLIGRANSAGAITDSSASGSVTSAFDAGGLVGYWWFSGGITDSRATGRVLGTGTGGSQGGLVGYGYSGGTITNSSAGGDVSGSTYVGALAGNLNFTSISRGSATGNVQGVGNSTVYAGGLVGYYYQPTAGGGISNSTATGIVFADSLGARAGGLVGQFDGGSLSGSSASGAVTARDSSNTASSSHFTGGLVGYFGGSAVSDSAASGAVTGLYYTGGLLGYSSGSGSATNVSATGNVSGTQYVGGLVGSWDYGSITNGFASGNVVGSSSGYVGGLLGYGSTYSTTGTNRISDSRATGDVTGGSSTGGLVGYFQEYYTTTSTGSAILQSSASGNVSGNSIAGGLVGNFNSSDSRSTSLISISRSAASGNVQARDSVGGLVGTFNSYSGIADSRATGNVSGTSTTSTQYLGGLVGYFRNYSSTTGTGLLQRSYASGNVAFAPGATLGTFSDVYGGGLVGFVDGSTATFVTLVDSYATGSVNLTAPSGRLRAGGLVGYTDASIARTYATGAVSATGTLASRQVGGLVGQRSTTTVTATSSYWATDTSGVATSIIGTASTSAALRNAATFTGWDIASTGGTTQTWRIYEGQTAPLLRAQLTPLTVSLADISKVYDGTAALGSGAISLGGTAVANPERIFVTGVSPNVGTYALGASSVYSVQNGYDLSVAGTANLTITPRPLTLAGLVLDKVYDGTTSATLATSPRLGGLVAGEDLVFNPGTGFTAQFATKGVGDDKLVNLTGGYAIADGVRGLASNYTAPTATTTTADITPRTLTAGTFAATNRVYDGTTAVAVSAVTATLAGKVAGDDVNVDLTSVSSGTVADKNVGTAKPVAVTGVSLSGGDAANYRLAGVDAVTVDITPKLLTVNGITATDRPYNQGRSVGLGASDITSSGLVAGDSVLPRLTSFSGTVADKNVGNAKPVTVTGLGLRGPDAANYTPQAGAVSVNITPYLLTLFLSTPSTTNRVYDGTTNTNAFIPTFYWYSGDAITATASSIAFSDKNVAYNSSGAVVSKTITATGIAISGADAANYALQNTTATIQGTITPKPLAVSGVSAVNRVYNGSRDVTVNISGATVDTTAVVPGDIVSVATPGTGSVTGQVADKNVGNAKAVTVPGLSLTGTDAGNYTITSGTGGGVTVNITRKDLTATYTALNKVYDGNPYATMNVTSSDIVTGDIVNFYIDQTYCGINACGYARFTESGFGTGGSYTDSRHVGTNKPVVIIFNQLVDRDAGNYTLLNPTGSTTASITPKPVTLAFSGVSKVYDGTTAATVSLNFGASGLFSGDTLTSTQTAIYTGTNAKNAGTGKPIAVSDIVLSGAQAGNYTVANATATTTGTVTAKPITVSGITATDRAYDGTTSVAVTAGTVGSAGFVSTDVVSVSLPPGGLSTGTLANKNVGTNKPVTVTGLSLTGADAGNYSIDATGSGITVNITPAALTPTYSSVSRVYNGGTTATVVSTTTGIASGDTVTFSQLAFYTGTNARDAGTGKPISITGITLGGSGAANYSLASTTATTTGDITPKPVTITYTGGSRVYNGLADVTASVIGNSLQFIAGDAVGVSQTALFTGDGSAGVNKPVAISGITLTGTQATNYSLLGTTATTTATITPRPLGVTGITATNRVYDGTTTVSVNVAGATVDTSTVITGDSVSVVLPPAGISTGTMSDRNVGNNKPVAITGLTITGASAANYSLVGAAGLRVNITPKAVSAVYAGINKVYDGNANATVTASSSDVLAIDAGLLGISADGVFAAGKNVGTGKTVNFTGAFLTGSARDNYALLNPDGSTTADITPRALTASFAGGSKVYDGTITAAVTGSLGGRISGDSVATSQVAVFTGTNARDVGAGKPIDVSSITLTGADAGNYTLGTTSATATGSITPKPITVSGLSSLTATDRVYDGTRAVSVTVPTGVTLVPDSSDIIAGDIVNIAVPSAGTTTGTVANKNAGTGKAVNVDGLSLSGAQAGNYSIAGTAGITVNITPRSLTAVFAGVNKVYDGGTGITVSGNSSDLLTGDSLLISGTGVLTGTGAKNVGLGKPVDVLTARLSGTDAGNYRLVNTTGATTADVTPRAITPTYAGGSRFYDGTTTAPVTSTSGGFVFGDSITLSQTAVFSGARARNAGTGKPITISGITLSGADAANYSLTGTTGSTTGTIAPKPITLIGLTGVTAANRVYDGTRTVAVNVTSSGTIGVDPADLVAGDVVSVLAPVSGLTTGTMINKNVGIGKAVVVDGLTLTGADAANYSVAATSGLTVNISPRDLTAVYGGLSKVYDGSTTATVGGSSTDLLSGDVLAITGTGRYSAGKNVGTGKAIEVTAGRLTGVDAANYTLLNTTGSATGDITPRAVTVSYLGGSRVYDGTTAAPVTGTVGGLISGDSVLLSQTALFTGTGAKNAGTGKAVSITGISLGGTDGANYSLVGSSATTTASITPRPLGLLGLTGVTATNRAYDGTLTVAVTVATTGTVTPNPADLIAGDDVTVTAPPAGATTGTLLDKNVGVSKPVAVAGLTLGGADAGNYSVASTSGVTVNITPRNLIAAYIGVNRTYDGTTAASVIGSSADIVAGDSVLIGATGVFSGTGARNAGTGKTIDITAGRLTSTDAGNYVLTNPTGTTTADVTPRAVSITYAGTSRVYDGTAAAPVSRNASGLIAGDAVSLSETAVFTGAGAKNIGTIKAIAVSGVTLSGADAANYALLTTAATTTGGITPRPLNVTGLSGITAVDRVYDGTASVAIVVSGSIGSVGGDVIAGDDITVNLPTSGLGGGVMANKNVGTSKPVVLTGLSLGGADAANYVIAGTAGVTVNITPRALTPVYTGVNKIYDGTVAASVAGTSADLLAGDTVLIAATGEFTGAGARNVGTGKAVRVVAGALSGADAVNYTLLGGNTGTTADITPRSVSAVYAAGTRVYDGTSLARVTRTVSGLVDGDAVTLSDTAVFTGSGAKNVGSGKLVEVTGITLSGADAGNYALITTSASTTGSITPRPLNISGISGITATDRVYDGTLDVTVTTPTSLGTLSGDVIAGDTVGIAIGAGGLGRATLVDKNAGTNKAVVLSGLTLSGPDAANYTIGGTAGVTVNIAPKAVALLGVAAVDRTYDGTTAVAITTAGGSISGALSGDDVSLPTTGVSGRVADKNAGSNRAVTVSGLSLAGADAGNYTVTAGSGLTVNITPRTLNASATVLDRIYNGTTGATVNLSSDALTGDTLTLSAAGATYATPNAGSSIAVNVSGLALAGADAGNYVLASSTVASSGNIGRAPLSVSARNLSKTYGDTLAFTGSDITVTGLVTGETLGSVALTSAGAAATAAVAGSPYAITVGSPTGGSFNPLNYDATLVNGQLVVQPRPLTIAVNSLVRYAGVANPEGAFGLSTSIGGLVNGDALAVGQTVSAPAGSDTAEGVSLYSLLPTTVRLTSGSLDNYAVRYSPGQLLILPKPPAAGEGGGGAGVDLAVQISEEELARARTELARAALTTQTGTQPPGAQASPPVMRSAGLLTPAEVSLLLSGDGQRLTLPALQKLPLITFDPQLRRGVAEAAGGQ